MFEKLSIHYILLGSVILITLAIFVIFCVIRKSKEKSESYTSSGVISGCKVAPAMQFLDVPYHKECPSSVIDTGNIKAAYILFIRHCDRGYRSVPSNKPYIPQPLGKDGKPGTKIRTTCSNQTSGCLGCEYMDTLEGCATNNCSEKGVKRSWALGKWIDCFAKDKVLPISTVVGEIFEPGLSNQRPHTTAAIIYESLMNLNHSPCWFTAKKDNSDHAIKKYVQSDNVENKIVVVVWNHGGLPGLITDVTSFAANWNQCCFDKVVVMDSKANKLTSYDAKSLEAEDLCGSPCKIDDSTISPYVTSEGQTCSYAIFGDSTPCTLPDSPTTIPTSSPTHSPTPVPPESDCYKEGENPFGLGCTKSACCPGTKLRLHHKDSKHQDPYYICSSDINLPTNITPKCDSKTSRSCFTSSFCQPKQPTDQPKQPTNQPKQPTDQPKQPTDQPTGEDCESEYNKDCPVKYWRCKYTDITSGCWPENQINTAKTECKKHNNAGICKKH